MSRRWHLPVPCPRKGCEGHVLCHGYASRSARYGGMDGLGADAEDEAIAEACDTCGYGAWTAAEIDRLTEYARDV